MMPGATRPGRCDGGTPIGPENRRFSGGRSGHYTWRIMEERIPLGSAIGPVGPALRCGWCCEPSCDWGCDSSRWVESRPGAAQRWCGARSTDRDRLRRGGEVECGIVGRLPVVERARRRAQGGSPAKRGRSVAKPLTLDAGEHVRNAELSDDAVRSHQLCCRKGRRRREPPRRRLHAGLLLRGTGPSGATPRATSPRTRTRHSTRLPRVQPSGPKS